MKTIVTLGPKDVKNAYFGLFGSPGCVSPLYMALEPECEIFMFMGSLGTLTQGLDLAGRSRFITASMRLRKTKSVIQKSKCLHSTGNVQEERH